jgi:hypothetical protein
MALSDEITQMRDLRDLRDPQTFLAVLFRLFSSGLRPV